MTFFCFQLHYSIESTISSYSRQAEIFSKRRVSLRHLQWKFNLHLWRGNFFYCIGWLFMNQAGVGEIIWIHYLIALAHAHGLFLNEILKFSSLCISVFDSCILQCTCKSSQLVDPNNFTDTGSIHEERANTIEKISAP